MHLTTAENKLKTGGYTCVLTDGESFYTSTDRGVKPLVQFIEKQNLSAEYFIPNRAQGVLLIEFCKGCAPLLLCQDTISWEIQGIPPIAFSVFIVIKGKAKNSQIGLHTPGICQNLPQHFRINAVISIEKQDLFTRCLL